MSRDTTVIQLRQPDAIDDPLSELAREGARRMLGQVLIAEADAFVAMWKDVKLPDGRDRVVVSAIARVSVQCRETAQGEFSGVISASGRRRCHGDSPPLSYWRRRGCGWGLKTYYLKHQPISRARATRQYGPHD